MWLQKCHQWNECDSENRLQGSQREACSLATIKSWNEMDTYPSQAHGREAQLRSRKKSNSWRWTVSSGRNTFCKFRCYCQRSWEEGTMLWLLYTITSNGERSLLLEKVCMARASQTELSLTFYLWNACGCDVVSSDMQQRRNCVMHIIIVWILSQNIDYWYKLTKYQQTAFFMLFYFQSSKRKLVIDRLLSMHQLLPNSHTMWATNYLGSACCHMTWLNSQPVMWYCKITHILQNDLFILTKPLFLASLLTSC